MKPKAYRNSKGELHRLDGPAFISLDGSKIWCQNGLYHRLDGPAVEMAGGTNYWYQNDLLHRLDGPAIIRAEGTNEWFQNGLRHRFDGPAIDHTQGPKSLNAWYIYNEDITDEVNAWLKEQNVKLPMTESELSMFILKFVGK
jgi:hypothetical protein